MFGITSEQVGGAIRWAIGIAGATYVAKGTISEPDLATVAGALASIAALIWSVYIKRAAAVGK